METSSQTRGHAIKRARNSNRLQELKGLLESGNLSAQIEMAKNLNCPENIYTLLADVEDEIVLHFLAANTKTPKNVLEKLLGHKEMIVREYAKLNWGSRFKNSSQTEGEQENES